MPPVEDEFWEDEQFASAEYRMLKAEDMTVREVEASLKEQLGDLLGSGRELFRDIKQMGKGALGEAVAARSAINEAYSEFKEVGAARLRGGYSEVSDLVLDAASAYFEAKRAVTDTTVDLYGTSIGVKMESWTCFEWVTSGLVCRRKCSLFRIRCPPGWIMHCSWLGRPGCFWLILPRLLFGEDQQH